MTITFTKEQLDTLLGLCDVALKVGGLQNLDKVLELINLIKTSDKTEEK